MGGRVSPAAETAGCPIVGLSVLWRTSKEPSEAAHIAVWPWVRVTHPTLKLVISWSLWQPPYLLHMTSIQSGTTSAASEQPIVSMETEGALRLLTMLLFFATQKANLHPGLPSTMAPESPSRGLRSSPETDAVGSRLVMLTSALQMSFQRLLVRCLMAVPFLAITRDLPRMDNS